MRLTRQGNQSTIPSGVQHCAIWLPVRTVKRLQHSNPLFCFGLPSPILDDRPTQSVMYVPLLVNRFSGSFLLIVQYRYLKSCSGDFNSPESDPANKIMRQWFYCSMWLGFSFQPDRIRHIEMICIGGVTV